MSSDVQKATDAAIALLDSLTGSNPAVLEASPIDPDKENA